jgi:tetratricopeptide (TPR) repeat protein
MSPESDVLMNAVLAAAPIAVAGAVAALFLLGSQSRPMVFGSLFFLITLLPVLQIVPVGPAIVSDRHTYIPMIGICFIAAWAAARVVNGTARKSILAVLVILSITSGILTFQRCRVWKNDMTLWNDCIRKYPSSLAYNNRGAAYGDRGAMDRAIADFNRAILLDPRQTRAYNNRGIAYLSKGILERALQDFNKSVELDTGYFDAFDNRGIIYDCTNEFDKALADFARAIALKPDYAKAYINRGIAYTRHGFFDLAVRDFDRAIVLDPGNVTAAENRKRAIAAMGNSGR